MDIVRAPYHHHSSSMVQDGVLISNLAFCAWPAYNASQVQRQEKVGQPQSICVILVSNAPQQTSFASISFYPGVAQGAWKHTPIILLPRCHALLQAYPPFSDQPKHPCG